MHIPKKYGASKVDNCPFCKKHATSHNKQGVPVCVAHKGMNLPEFKCICGEYLTLMTGKFGPYFNCPRCGNINMRKALETNNPNIGNNHNVTGVKAGTASKEKVYAHKPTDITVRSDDPRDFD